MPAPLLRPIRLAAPWMLRSRRFFQPRAHESQQSPPQRQPPEPSCSSTSAPPTTPWSAWWSCSPATATSYRVFAPGRKVVHVAVVNHPDDVKRVLVSNHKNYTKGVGLDQVKILLGNRIMTSERRVLETPALHDAAGFPSARHHRLQPAHRRLHRALHPQVGRSGRARRARERDGGHERADARHRPALHLPGRISSGSATQPGGNPFDVVTKEQARDLKFAYRFRSLGKVITGHREPSPRSGRGASRLHRHAQRMRATRKPAMR